MKKTLLALTAAAALTAATALPAAAQSYTTDRYAPNYAAPLAGAVVGTAVGVGLYNGWYGSGPFVSALPGATVAGAATTGLVAGIGTVALLDAATEPCRGFAAISPWAGERHDCVNGQYVGNRAVYTR